MNLSNALTGLFIFYTLTDPFFILLEYINGLSVSILSIKRLEVFLFKKEYNTNKLIKNTNPREDGKTVIEIDDMDFDIIKKKEEFNNQHEEEFRKKDDKLSSSNESEEEKDSLKELELQD